MTIPPVKEPPVVPPTNEPPPTPAPAPNEPPPEKDWKAEAEKWQALSRKNETLAKQNTDAVAKLAEIENASKSELEKATLARDVAVNEASTAKLELLRARVAMRKNLTEAQSKRLVGATEEELEADADELLATFKPANNNGDTETASRNRPRESLRPGTVPGAKVDETDPLKLAAAVPR